MNEETTSAQSCPPKEIPPPIPPPTPPPSDDDSGSATDVTTLDFCYYGKEDSARGYNSGQLVQHSMPLEGATRTYIFSLRAGPHERRTLAELTVKALLGPCEVAIKFGPTQTLPTGDEMTIPTGSTFTLQTNAKAVLHITSLGDPGLGGGHGGGSIIER